MRAATAGDSEYGWAAGLTPLAGAPASQGRSASNTAKTSKPVMGDDAATGAGSAALHAAGLGRTRAAQPTALGPAPSTAAAQTAAAARLAAPAGFLDTRPRCAARCGARNCSSQRPTGHLAAAITVGITSAAAAAETTTPGPHVCSKPSWQDSNQIASRLSARSANSHSTHTAKGRSCITCGAQKHTGAASERRQRPGHMAHVPQRRVD
eukprot:365849-Chlamydomonas_euryale.AAC.3